MCRPALISSRDTLFSIQSVTLFCVEIEPVDYTLELDFMYNTYMESGLQ
jgi:hypothetical protein